MHKALYNISKQDKKYGGYRQKFFENIIMFVHTDLGEGDILIL
jgi:hypothetical protein